MIAFRLDVDQLAEIDKRAKEFRMSRTDYLIAAALDNLASARDEMRTWRDEVERRLKSLERMADLGGMG